MILLPYAKYFKKSIYLFPGLFLGLTPGAPFHCANYWNFFVLAKGRKQWTFIHPEHSLQVGCLINPSAIYSDGCVTGKGGTWRDEDELYKKYCPKYRTIIEEGDVLLNPPWWWHEIQNLTPFTAAVATRWFVFKYGRTNVFFDFIQLISRQMWQVNYHGILTSGGDCVGNPEDDDLIRKFTANRDKIPRYNRDYGERCCDRSRLLEN